MAHENEDRRVRKTKKQLRGALTSLLLEKDISHSTVRDVADLGGGLLLADVHYKTVITALQGPVEVEDQAQVVLRWVNGELLADALYHY